MWRLKICARASPVHARVWISRLLLSWVVSTLVVEYFIKSCKCMLTHDVVYEKGRTILYMSEQYGIIHIRESSIGDRDNVMYTPHFLCWTKFQVAYDHVEFIEDGVTTVKARQRDIYQVSVWVCGQKNQRKSHTQGFELDISRSMQCTHRLTHKNTAQQNTCTFVIYFAITMKGQLEGSIVIKLPCLCRRSVAWQCR